LDLTDAIARRLTFIGFAIGCFLVDTCSLGTTVLGAINAIVTIQLFGSTFPFATTTANDTCVVFPVGFCTARSVQCFTGFTAAIGTNRGFARFEIKLRSTVAVGFALRITPWNFVCGSTYALLAGDFAVRKYWTILVFFTLGKTKAFSLNLYTFASHWRATVFTILFLGAVGRFKGLFDALVVHTTFALFTRWFTAGLRTVGPIFCVGRIDTILA